MTNNQKADLAGLKFQMRVVEKGFVVRTINRQEKNIHLLEKYLW